MTKGWTFFHTGMFVFLYALVLHSHLARAGSCRCPSCRQMNIIQRCECCVYRQLGKRSGPIANPFYSHTAGLSKSDGLSRELGSDSNTSPEYPSVLDLDAFGSGFLMGPVLGSHQSPETLRITASGNDAPSPNEANLSLNGRGDPMLDGIVEVEKDTKELVQQQKRDEEKILFDPIKRSGNRNSFYPFHYGRDYGISNDDDIQLLQFYQQKWMNI